MIINVVIAEDDANKLRNIRSVLAAPRGCQLEIQVATCRSELLSVLRAGRFDLLVLDLVMPLEAGGMPRESAGSNVLDMMNAGVVRAVPHVVVVSGFREVAAKFDAEFRSLGWRAVHYEPGLSDWAEVLRAKIEHVARCGMGGGYVTDVVCVCALEFPELAALRALPYGWREYRDSNDDSMYLRGSFALAGDAVSVVAVSCGRMGMPVASAVTMKAIECFRPRVLAMCGIAAGRVGQFGDVLVATDSWDAGAGKFLSDGRLHVEPTQSHADARMCALIRRFEKDPAVLAALLDGWTGAVPPGLPPGILIGPLASGSAVVAYRSEVERLVGVNRKLIGLDMEIHGVYQAVEVARRPRPAVIGVKGICDHADDRKGDSWQDFAAHTSARFFDCLMHEYFRRERG